MGLPFLNAYGLVPKILDKIIQAAQPSRFTQDFLGSKLGFDSGSARPIIPLLKKLGMLASDGTPTALYSRFRNPEARGVAMAEAIKNAYKEIFERNEYANTLAKDKLKNLIVEITGSGADDPTVSCAVNTFLNLSKYADFDANSDEVENKKAPEMIRQVEETAIVPGSTGQQVGGLNLAYTIYLNLPETTDVEVFNAIFRSLKENLLKG